jgi:biotin carboxyl carrier protein
MRYLASIGGAEREFEIEELPAAGAFRVRLGGQNFDADLRQVGPASFSVIIGGRAFDFDVVRDGDEIIVASRTGVTRLSLEDAARRAMRGSARGAKLSGRVELKAMMPGRVVAVLVAAGDEVRADQGIVVIEAMKMENELRSPKAGKVAEVKVVAGQTVEKGDLLVVIE